MFLVKSSAKYSFYGVGKWQGAKDIIHHEGTITFSFERHVGNIHKGRPCTTKLRYSQKKVKNANGYKSRHRAKWVADSDLAQKIE